jgi:hypothetical protein
MLIFSIRISILLSTYIISQSKPSNPTSTFWRKNEMENPKGADQKAYTNLPTERMLYEKAYSSAAVYGYYIGGWRFLHPNSRSRPYKG